MLIRTVLRIFVILAVLCDVAAADSNTLTLDGNAMVGLVGPMLGGSVHYEHRFVGEAVAASVAGGSGERWYEGDFQLYTAFVGYRYYIGSFYGEAEVGAIGVRSGRTVDDFDINKHYGVEWFVLPDGQLTLGAKLGPVDIGIYTNIPNLGIGAQLGFDFATF